MHRETGGRKKEKKKIRRRNIKETRLSMNHFGLSVEPEARSDFTSTLDGAGIFTHAANPLAWRCLHLAVTTGGGAVECIEARFVFFNSCLFVLRTLLMRRTVTCAKKKRMPRSYGQAGRYRGTPPGSCSSQVRGSPGKSRASGAA